MGKRIYILQNEEDFGQFINFIYNMIQFDKRLFDGRHQNIDKLYALFTSIQKLPKLFTILILITKSMDVKRLKMENPKKYVIDYIEGAVATPSEHLNCGILLKF